MQEAAGNGFDFIAAYKPEMPPTKQEGMYFLSGSMQGTKRNDHSLLSKDMIVLDYDALSQDFTPEPFYNAIHEKLKPYDFLAYPTISHKEKTPKYRVILPLSEPMNNKDQYRAVLQYVADMIGLPYDVSSEKWSQLQGLPVHEGQTMRHASGLRFDADTHVLMVDRWARRNRAKLEDYDFYLKAHFVICRAVVAGEITLQQGKTCVTILCSDPDERAENIQKLRQEIRSAQRSHEPLEYFRIAATIPEFFEGLPPAMISNQDSGLWLGELDRHKEGYLLKTTTNLKTILANDPALKDLFIYNEFSELIEKADTPPWEGNFSKQWTDTDLGELDIYMGDTWKLEFTATKLHNAVLSNARTHRYHPIKSMIELQAWDGVPRAETIFTDYLGANNDPYVRAAARKWLSGAVARIYEPGIKFEIVPVLIGKQGRGKSTIAAKLGGKHFSDDLKDMKSKDAKEFLKGSWIVELGELSAMKRTEIDEVKAFISITSDRYRPSYGRVTTDNLRTCVFIGTTNDNQFLKDVTGNRRFYPIPIDQHERTKDIFTLDQETVQQIWAEAYSFYKAGEELYMPEDIEALAYEYREEATSEDPIATAIEQYLNILLPEDWDDYNLERKRAYIQEVLNNEWHHKEGTVQRERVTAKEISTELFCTDPKEELRGRGLIKNINLIMSNKPDWTYKPYRDYRNKSVRGYIRE